MGRQGSPSPEPGAATGAADVFISYSRLDAEFVTWLVDRLGAEGCTAWLDQKGIPASAEWMREILGAIERADCFVCVVTPDAAGSEVCTLEVRHALANNKRILPVLRRAVPPGTLVPELERVQWVDFRDDSRAEAAVAQLLGAIRTDPEALHLHTRVLTRAVQWRDSRRDRNLLLRGTELANAEAWLCAPAASPEPTDLQREFVRAGRLAADRRRRIGIGLGVGTLCVLAVLGIVSLRERRVARERALVALAGETASQALAQVDRAYDLALLVAVEAHHVRPTVDTAAALQRVLLHRPQLSRILRGATARAVALRFDAAGRRLMAGLGDSSLVAWDIDTGRFEPVLPPAGTGYVDAFALDGALARAASGGGHQRDITVRSVPAGERMAHIAAREWYAIQALAFSPTDAQLLASANGNGATGASLWDLVLAADPNANPERFGPLVGDGGVAAIAFSPDGRALATAGWNTGVVLWSVATGERTGRVDLGDASVSALAFDPTGRLLLAAGDRGVVLADLAAPDAPPRTLEKPDGAVRSVAASPDGRWLAAGLEAGRAVVWDLQTERAQPIVLDGLETYVDSLAFSADGRQLASGDYREGIAVWALGGIDRFGRVLGTHGAPVRAVAIAPDGATVASGGWDRTVRLWPARRTGGQAATLAGHAADVYALAFADGGATLVSADSRVLPTARGVADVIRWNLSVAPPRAASALPARAPATGLAALMQDLPALRDNAFPIALGAGGARLARIEVLQDPRAPNGVRPVVEVRDVERPGVTVATLATDHRHDVAALALSADGGLVVTAGGEGRIEVWDVARGERLAAADATGARACGAVALDQGAALLAVGCDSDIHLYELRGGMVDRGRLVGHGAEVTAIAFAAGGERLASADRAGYWSLWDVASGRMIGRPFSSGAPIHALALADDGATVVTGDAKGRVIVWDAGVESWLASACRAANRDLTPEEWRRFLPDRPQESHCAARRSGGAP